MEKIMTLLSSFDNFLVDVFIQKWLENERFSTDY